VSYSVSTNVGLIPGPRIRDEREHLVSGRLT
jgi:hypothetical protein